MNVKSIKMHILRFVFRCNSTGTNRYSAHLGRGLESFRFSRPTEHALLVYPDDWYRSCPRNTVSHFFISVINQLDAQNFI